jgi:hypothetical protein
LSSSSKEEGYQDEKNDDKSYDIIETIDNYSGIQSNIIDVRSAQKVQETSNSTSFPNPAYEAFVQLVTKHKLADSVANDIIHLFNNFHMDPTATLPSNAKAARTLLDSIKIPHILYKKTIVMEYNQIQYTLHHRTIFDAIKELLSNKEIFKYCVFDYNPEYITNDKGEQERCYSELYNSEWWGRAQKSINENAKVLSIIIYSDATTCDMLGKTSEHPVFLTLGNIPSWRRNKPDAKSLLAYLPKIDDNQKKQADFVLAKLHLFHRSMKILLEPIISGGLDLQTDNGILWCYPFLSILLGDLPEHHSITLTYNSANCKMPCHICTIPKDELNDPLIDYSTIQIRTPEAMQYVLENGISEEYSLHKIENPFWKLS